MRFYRIQILDTTGNTVLYEYSSLVNGQFNPSALNIEVDIPIAVYAEPAGYAMVRIWGIPLSAIGSANNLNDKKIKVYGGMSRGYPLATPSQQGLLVQGTIFQAFGNWVGTDMTIDLIITASEVGTVDAPVNFTFNWPKGTPMADAIRTTLKRAIPGAKIVINIASTLTLNHSETGYHQTLSQFAQVVKQLSQQINPSPTYPGVDIVYHGAVITVSDGTNTPKVTAIQPQDLIGQPTWFEPQTIQVKLVMRGDLNLQDQITLPQTIIKVTDQALQRFAPQNNPTFTGKYTITYIRHIGNYRQPDAASWNTTINVFPPLTGTGLTESTGTTTAATPTGTGAP